jgi:hypothetical protein
MVSPDEGLQANHAAEMEALEIEVRQRCADMIDDATAEAARIISEAEFVATERSEVDAQLLVALAEQVQLLSASYREAMTAARRTVEHLAAMLRALPGNGVGASGLEGADDGQHYEHHAEGDGRDDHVGEHG